jgi:hypothetical protein
MAVRELTTEDLNNAVRGLIDARSRQRHAIQERAALDRRGPGDTLDKDRSADVRRTACERCITDLETGAGRGNNARTYVDNLPPRAPDKAEYEGLEGAAPGPLAISGIQSEVRPGTGPDRTELGKTESCVWMACPTQHKVDPHRANERLEIAPLPLSPFLQPFLFVHSNRERRRFSNSFRDDPEISLYISKFPLTSV